MLTGQKEKPGRAAVYCRVSSDEQAEVVKLGTQLDQIAIWDVAKGESINTGGTGEAKSMSKKSDAKTGKKVFARPGDDMTDEELKAFSKAMYKMIMGHDYDGPDEGTEPTKWIKNDE